MRLGLGFRGWTGCGVLALGMAAGAGARMAGAQGSVSISEPPAPLLPLKFGEWKQTTGAAAAYPFELAQLNKAALEEGQPQRSAVATYERGEGGAEHTIYVEAIEFADRTGAYNAFTLAARPGMNPAKGLGDVERTGENVALVESGATVLLVNGVSAGETGSLKPLVEMLPKAVGNKALAPLLPTLAPEDGLVAGSVKYAVGAETYAGEGGVLPAQSLMWDKSAEAVTAQYSDERGKETLTLLLYPTPEIAGAMAKRIAGEMGGMGAGFASAKVRREGEMVILASGGYTADNAQRMVNGVHLKQELSIDKDVQPGFHTEVQKTFSLLFNIAVLSGVLMVAAVLLALFLGAGRAAVRVMRGKPAAVEPEFLSLHLAPQNKPVEFERTE